MTSRGLRALGERASPRSINSVESIRRHTAIQIQNQLLLIELNKPIKISSIQEMIFPWKLYSEIHRETGTGDRGCKGLPRIATAECKGYLEYIYPGTGKCENGSMLLVFLVKPLSDKFEATAAANFREN